LAVFKQDINAFTTHLNAITLNSTAITPNSTTKDKMFTYTNDTFGHFTV